MSVIHTLKWIGSRVEMIATFLHPKSDKSCNITLVKNDGDGTVE